MFSIFRTKPLLSEEDLEFQIATYGWLLRNFGQQHFHNNASLILPTREFFPSEVTSADEASIETFNRVKRYAGMEHWPCTLVAQEEDVSPRIAPTVAIQNKPNGPLGTFQAAPESGVTISYNPSLTAQPMQLVATLAHELSHYLTSTAAEAPPGGWDNWEFATDITATFLGFGIFMANSAFNFRQYTDSDSQGWQVSGSGYLSEAEHIFALAIFLKLKGIPLTEAQSHLKPSLRKPLRKAAKELSSLMIIDNQLTN